MKKLLPIILAGILVSCNSYERKREVIIQDIINLGREDSIKYHRIINLEDILSNYTDAEGNSILTHCIKQMERSASDIEKLKRVSFTESGLLSGSTQRTVKAITPLDVYEKDIDKLVSILKGMPQTEYVSHVSKIFIAARKKTKNWYNSFGIGNMFALLMGDNSSFVEPFNVVHTAYSDVCGYIITSVDPIISDYAVTVLEAAVKHSARLKADEFSEIYFDLLRNTASEYLGDNILKIIIDDQRYEYLHDAEIMFAQYQSLQQP